MPCFMIIYFKNIFLSQQDTCIIQTICKFFPFHIFLSFGRKICSGVDVKNKNELMIKPIFNLVTGFDIKLTVSNDLTSQCIPPWKPFFSLFILNVAILFPTCSVLEHRFYILLSDKCLVSCNDIPWSLNQSHLFLLLAHSMKFLPPWLYL